ncbi:lipopolysaccharide-induced tumor necrosis factor-alpha factor homolog [Cloeon dipterum]|uniref:lipopolysaccharide-induced tumor necrosis factor-alpha factor homolog n=1 Tax=Cloeon dipterum TaxID=197152 RepID=UPI0032201C26
MHQPSAPFEGKMQPPNAPPSYHEAIGGGPGPGNVGWNVPHTGGTTQPIMNVQPLHPAPSHTVPGGGGPIVHQMHVVNVVMVGPSPIHTACPNCGAEVKTMTVTTPKSMAHLGCIALCLTGFWFCCCLPYCFDACKKTDHTCPSCKALIGTYNG